MNDFLFFGIFHVFVYDVVAKYKLAYANCDAILKCESILKAYNNIL